MPAVDDQNNNSDAFSRLDQLEVESLLEEVNPALGPAPFNPATATILAQDLSFYPGYRFLDIADYEVTPPPRRFVIHRPGHTVILNGTNEPIYGLNERAPPVLNESTVCDYVRFFFTYVRGKHGRFLITETVDDVHWKEEPPPAARKAIGKMLEPVHIRKKDAQGNFIVATCMVFKDSLFRADALVKPGGLITLTNEQLVIEDMPVLDDTFGL